MTPAFGRSPGPGRGRPQSAIENPALAGGVEQPWSGRPDGTGQPETRLAGLPCSEQHVAGQRTADLKVFSSATVYGRNKPLADIDQLTGLGVAQPQAVADCSPAPVHELERYMRCKDCSAVRRYAFKRSQLIALRPSKITVESPPSEMWRAIATRACAGSRSLSIYGYSEVAIRNPSRHSCVAPLDDYCSKARCA